MVRSKAVCAISAGCFVVSKRYENSPETRHRRTRRKTEPSSAESVDSAGFMRSRTFVKRSARGSCLFLRSFVKYVVETVGAPKRKSLIPYHRDKTLSIINYDFKPVLASNSATVIWDFSAACASVIIPSFTRSVRTSNIPSI